MSVSPIREQQERFERLVAEHADAILRMGYVILLDRQQAEDAMQETFLKAWRHFDQFTGGRILNEKAWLMRIAINVCRDYRRGRWFRHVDQRTPLSDLPQRYIEVLPEDHSLLMDVCSLPERYKQVLLLYYYQEMTLSETGDALGISPSAVRKRLLKAQELLKGRLTGREVHE